MNELPANLDAFGDVKFDPILPNAQKRETSSSVLQNVVSSHRNLNAPHHTPTAAELS